MLTNHTDFETLNALQHKKPPHVGLKVANDYSILFKHLDELGAVATTTLKNFDAPQVMVADEVFTCHQKGCRLSFKHKVVLDEHLENSHRKVRV